MKIGSVKIQNNKPSFKGKLANAAVNFVSKHPMAVAGLAGSSVVAQKIVMSGSEATIGPVMDLGIGKILTAATGEKDDRINQSSKTQAIRTCSQSVGGTITGVIIRSACIALSTLALMKAGEKAGGKIAQIINQGNNGKVFSKTENLFEYTENIQSWGKTLGGAVAIGVMMFTNFLVDAPLINFLNKKMTNFIGSLKKHKQEKQTPPVNNDVQNVNKGGLNG